MHLPGQATTAGSIGRR